MRFMRKEKGITLVALIVTIVVIIILSTVTINLALSDLGIITRAQEAANIIQEAIKEEAVQINEIINDIAVEDGTTDRTELITGAYINYEPEPALAYTKLNQNNTGSSDNSTSITQEKLTWQILRVYDDGSIDLIGSPTSQTIFFQGTLGYNNGVYLMNDICESLYSRENIKARSINYEDIEYWLTDAGKRIRDNYVRPNTDVKYLDAKTYETYTYYPNLYAYEKGAGINTTETNENGLEISEEAPEQWNIMPTTETFSDANIIGLTVTETFWGAEVNNIYFGEGAGILNTNSGYWIASRYAYCDPNGAGFRITIYTR